MQADRPILAATIRPWRPYVSASWTAVKAWAVATGVTWTPGRETDVVDAYIAAQYEERT